MMTKVGCFNLKKTVKKDMKQNKTVTPKNITPNLSKNEKISTERAIKTRLHHYY